MYQVWLLLVTLEFLATTSLGQYSGNPYLDRIIDKTWQRHGGGFLNQESYAHDASKERKISTTIGTFGSPSGSSPYLRGQYGIPEFSSIYVPEVALTGSAERLIGVNHEPLSAIDDSWDGPVYINQYGQNYDRGAIIALAKNDDKVVYKEYSEHLPHDIIYQEHPIDKEKMSFVTHIHPSVQEEKFRKEPFDKEHFIVTKHEPKGERIVVDTYYKDLPKRGQIEVNTQEKIYKDAYEPYEDLHGKDYLIVKTEEKVFKDKFEPSMDRFYVDKIHKDIPGRDHIIHETVYKDLHHPNKKMLEKEHVVLSSQDKLYREESLPQKHILLDKQLYRDPYGRDSIALTAHEKAYKDVYDSPDLDGRHQISVKTEEIYQPKLGGYGKDHLTVKTQEKIYKDIPLPADKVTVENIYRTHAAGKPQLYEEPYFGYDMEYNDDKYGFEHSDETVLDGRELYKVNEKHVKVKVPLEESLITYRTRPTHRTSWPKKEIPCDPMSAYLDSSEC